MVSPPNDSVTILLVEDEALIRRLATTILERAGYRVIAAEDVARAWTAAAELDRPPDLMITDLGLPGGGGAALAARLRERWCGLRVVVVSGRPPTDMELPEDATFLAKPFGPSDLLAVVRGELSNGRDAGG